MNSYSLEVVATTVEGAIAGEAAGASRIELCSALETAGVTPSIGLLRACKAAVRIPVYMMIRPREGDFVYSKTELDVMKRDIEAAIEADADGLVFGFLTSSNRIDTMLTAQFVQLCQGRPVTFHRAFDVCADLKVAARELIGCGISTVLSSGGKASAAQGSTELHTLVESFGTQLHFMAGAGISCQTISQVFHPKMQWYHMSGNLPVEPRNQTALFSMDRKDTAQSEVEKVVQWLVQKG